MAEKIIIDTETKENFRAIELKKFKTLKAISNKTRLKILEILAEKPLYPRLISAKLNLPEQKVYYHFNLLKKQGFFEEKKSEGGAVKIYKTKPVAYCFIPKFAEKTEINLKNFLPSPPEILKNFIKEGEINCKIVVGATYPHGKFKKGSKSGYLGGEIAVFLGRYGVSKEKLIYIDEELTEEDKKDNLIIIGGMYVNTLQGEVNKSLPIKFDETGTKIISELSKDEYVDPDCGFICKSTNPFDKSKEIIVIGGLESAATRAGVFAFKYNINRIDKGNMYKKEVKGKVIKIIKDKEIVFLE
ncbi:winged helix-turn-helix transcriptional regulator [bacterium]|nr:winged helix-turn-helix transcriptional regulator [bacterium]